MEFMGFHMPPDDGLAAMATCFVGEFALMGYSQEALLALFRNPFYRGPHAAYERYGEPWVKDLIAREVGDRG